MKKRIVALLLSCAVSLSLCACGDSNSDKQKEQQEETVQEVKSEEADEDSSSGNSETTTIELVAGEQGQYGSQITMSSGTDMEENLIVYYLPAGKYEVTNIGENMTQVSVYEGFSRNEETGYDEYTSAGDVVLLDVDKTGQIEIPDGWFIEIQEPAHISLTLID